MDLEITIRVPLGAAGVSVDQRSTDTDAASAADLAAGAPPPTQVVEAMAVGNGEAEVVPPAAPGRATEPVPEPPSLAELGMPAPPRADAPPPPIEMIERQHAGAPGGEAPPGLEDLALAEVLDRTNAGTPAPPDLPDAHQVPSIADEFAPPAIEDLAPAAPRPRKGSSTDKGRARKR